MSPTPHASGKQIIDIGREIKETPSFDHNLSDYELERIPDRKWREQSIHNSVVEQKLEWTTTVAVLSHNAIAKIHNRLMAIALLVAGDIAIRAAGYYFHR